MKLRCQACQKENTVSGASQAQTRPMCMSCGLPLLPDASAAAARPAEANTADTPHERTEITGSIKLPKLAAADASQSLPRLSALVAAATHSLGTSPGADPEIMWHVRLAGGGERGPVSATQLQQWLQQGQISAQTPVWRIGMAQWQPFAQALPQRTPTEATAAVDDALAELDGRPPMAAAQPEQLGAEALPAGSKRTRMVLLAAAALLALLFAAAFLWLRPDAAGPATPAAPPAAAPGATPTAPPAGSVAPAAPTAAPIKAPVQAAPPSDAVKPQPAAPALRPAASPQAAPGQKSQPNPTHRSRSRRPLPQHKRRPAHRPSHPQTGARQTPH